MRLRYDCVLDMKLRITLRKPYQGRTKIIADKVVFDTGSIDFELDRFHSWDEGCAERLGVNPGGEVGRIRYEDVESIVAFDAYPGMN